MDDKNFITYINKIAGEEHALFDRESLGKATASDRERLKELEDMLDQCWDLLRQRRAKREFGQNPDEAHPRDAKTVKGYIG